MGEAEVPSGRRPQSKEPLFPRGDVCCTRQQPRTGDFCAAPFLRFLQCGSCWRARAGWPHVLCPAHHGGRKAENFDSNGCAHGAREAGRRRRCITSCAEKCTGGRPMHVGESARTRWSCRGSDRRISWPVDCTGEYTGQGDGVMGALGCTQRTRESRRVGSALEWQGGRRVSAHVQPARNFQGVSSATGSAQHEQSVQDVSFASGRRPHVSVE